MSNFVIPKGYQISVVSWENDGDNYKTQTISGLSKKEADIVCALCRLLDTNSPLSNMYDPDKALIKQLEDALESTFRAFVEPGESMLIGKYTCSNGEDLSDLLGELGIGATEYYYTRVCESYKVIYVPHDIVLEDVTNEFME